VHHPIFARLYARMSVGMEPEVAGNRRALLEGLRGRVIEVGAGNGLNFGHYPSTVGQVVALEPEPYLRGLAVTAAEQASVPVRVIDGTADHLAAIGAAGFVVDRVRRFRFPESRIPSPTAPHVLGTAHRPAG
jgi:hypothetical protein